MNTESEWSIHDRSGHCKHPIGLDAYVGQVADADFVPIVGPYSSKADCLSESDVAELACKLMHLIEDRSSSRYVVWGSLSSTSGGAKIRVLGEEKKWQPEPSARTNWMFQSPNGESQAVDAMQREWRIDSPYEILHRSGLGLRYSPECFSAELDRMITHAIATPFVTGDFDRSLWNEEIWQASSHCLAKVGFKLLCSHYGRDIPPRTVTVNQERTLRSGLIS